MMESISSNKKIKSVTLDTRRIQQIKTAKEACGKVNKLGTPTKDGYEMIENLADNLRTYCNGNNDLSVDALRIFFKDNIPTNITQDVLREASMLCDSKNISLDVVNCLLEYYPEGISVKNGEEYPLHVACMNKHCPSKVIVFLAEKFPAAIHHSSIEDCVKFPLHNYIESCPYDKIDIEIVLRLIKEYPETFSKDDDLFVDNDIGLKLADYLSEDCNESGLSITGLRERIERIPQTHIQYVLREAYMLCGNKNISLDIIKCLLEYYPEGASAEIETFYAEGYEQRAYPIHFACNNEYCPSDVIEFLMNQYPAAIRHSSVVDGGVEVPDSILDEYDNYDEVSGLPLHYYVSRPSSNIEKETIIKLANEYPESITEACGEGIEVAPIDILLNKNIFGFYSLARYCETKVVTVEKIKEQINNIPREQFFSKVCSLPEHLNLLQLVCSNKNVTLEAVEYLLAEYDPDAAGREIDVKYPHDPLTAYPLHWACMNSSCPDSVIQLLVTRYPTALRKVSVLDGGVSVDHPIPRELVQDEGSLAGLPLHYYLGRDENIDIDTVKMMVKQYPESLTTAGRDHALYYSAVYAPLDIMLMNQLQVMNSFEIVKLLIESNETFLTNQLAGERHSTLQIACSSFKMDPRIIKLIISTCPELICRTDRDGDTAVHILCRNRSLPDNVAVEILLLLIENDPSPLQIMNGHQVQGGDWEERMLPIHVAAKEGTKHLCKALYDADKDSISAQSSKNRLPLEVAASSARNLDTVKCLFDLDPSKLSKRVSAGRLFFREGSVENRSQATKVFLEAQWLYFMKAKNKKSLTVRDELGQVPLHHALCSDNVSLGSIKLLLDAHPDSLFIADNDGTLPFHLACGFSSSDIVEYLTEHFKVSSFGSSIKDMWGNTPLHYACRYGKLDTVKLLLEEKQEYIDSISVRNDDGKLPIQLLCEAPRLGLRKKIDRESTEYTETIWLLLRCCPETVVNW